MKLEQMAMYLNHCGMHSCDSKVAFLIIQHPKHTLDY